LEVKIVHSVVTVPEEIAVCFQGILKARGIDVALETLQEELVVHPTTGKVTTDSLCPFVEGKMTPAQVKRFFDDIRSKEETRESIEQRRNPRDPMKHRRRIKAALRRLS
jgi:hypothetical protein